MKASNNKTLWILLLALAAGLLAGCGGTSTPTSQAQATPLPSVFDEALLVSEGRLVPAESVELAFSRSGTVAEVLVNEGDTVKAGDVIARLGNREELEAAIASAEREVADAELALQALQDRLPNDQSAALQEIAEANKAVRDAQYNMDNFTIPPDHGELSAIEAVKVMKERRDQAWEAYKPYRGENTTGFDPRRLRDAGLPTNNANADLQRRLKETWDNALANYNTAIKRLELEVQLSTWQEKLDRALADYELLAEGPRAEEVKVAEARIKAAQAALTSAQASLKQLELRATVAGTVMELDLMPGEAVAAGQVVTSVVDFSHWYVETDDLNEIEVVNVTQGQAVQVVADALPDLELSGAVVAISDRYEDKQGDVTYTTRILLDKIDPRLRWGMTVVVTFER